MNDGDAFNFIRTKFKDEIQVPILGSPNSIPVQYDNGPSIDHKNTDRNLGLAITGIFARIEKGTKEIMEIADQVKEAFTSIKQNGVTYRTPSIEFIGSTNNLGSTEPNIWYQVNVVCPYYFDHIA